MKKTLAKLALGAALLGVTGCKDYEEYRFKGKIGEDIVQFEDDYGALGGNNYLFIVKPDDTRFVYMDTSGNDLKFEKVRVESKRKYKEWNSETHVTENKWYWQRDIVYETDSSNPEISKLAKEAQANADKYLGLILEHNTKSMCEEISRFNEM